MPAWMSPSDRFTTRQRRILILVGLASMSAAFVNTLFTQTVAYAAEEFDVGNSGQGIGAAIVRFGILLCLPIVAIADRRGRRPMMVMVAWAAPITCALGAVAPSFPALVATQTIGRPLGLTLDILIAVMAIEEMPRNSRAYATGVLALLSGLGAGVAVVALPLADIGLRSWRIIYLLALIWLSVAIALTKWLPESERFGAQSTRSAIRRFEIPSALRKNLGRLCSAAFLSNLFVAAASIFQNRYLKEVREYSAASVAIFTIATSSPASVGLLLGGRIADERGRRLLGALMVPTGATLIASSFGVSGRPMWLCAIAGGFAFGLAFPAMAVYRGELFPTNMRSYAGGIIMTSSLLGGMIGLVGAGHFLDRGASYATVMSCLLVGPFVAAALVWFRYPETAHLELEEITGEEPHRAR